MNCLPRYEPAVLVGFEAGEHSLDGVRPGLHRDEIVFTLLVGDGLAVDTRFLVQQLDGHAGDDAVGIPDRAAKAACERLRPGGGSAEGNRERHDPQPIQDVHELRTPHTRSSRPTRRRRQGRQPTRHPAEGHPSKVWRSLRQSGVRRSRFAPSRLYCGGFPGPNALGTFAEASKLRHILGEHMIEHGNTGGHSRRTFIKGVIAAGATVSASAYLFRTTILGQNDASLPGSVERLISLDVNGQQRRVDVLKHETLATTLQYAGTDRHEDRLRPVRVRGVHGYSSTTCRTPARSSRTACGAGRCRRSKGSPPRRHAQPGPAGRARRPGLPVRLLHDRIHHGHHGLPQDESQPHPRRAGARHLRQSVPVRGLQQDPRLHDERRRAREEGVMADEHHSRPHPAHPHLAHLHPARPAHLAHLPHPVPPSFPPIDPNGFKLIGKNYTTQDLLAKVTGRARYAEDFRADGMLFAKLMLSPRPHARIVSIDASRALAMPGVHAVLTADDLPPPAPPAGPPRPPERRPAPRPPVAYERWRAGTASKRPRVRLRRPAPVRPPHPGRHRPPRPCLQRNRLRQHRRRFRPSSRWQRRQCARANQSWPLPPTARNWPRPRSNRFRSSSRRSTSPSIRSIACVRRPERPDGRQRVCRRRDQDD